MVARKIFINYRRDDSLATAGRMHDRLSKDFGRKSLFMDVDHIPAGVDFLSYLNAQVAQCDVFLAVIGPLWLDARDETGNRRLDNPEDFVVIEIAAALARDIRVIPVLVDGARMPSAQALPDGLKNLARRNAVELRNSQFGRDADVLSAKIREAFQSADAPGPWILRWSIAAFGAIAVPLTLFLTLSEQGSRLRADLAALLGESTTAVPKVPVTPKPESAITTPRTPPPKSEPPVFVGRWGNSDRACDYQQWSFEEADRKVVFSGNAAQYLIPRDSGYSCSYGSVAREAGDVVYTSTCTSSDWRAIAQKSGTLRLRAEGNKLMGTGPDGTRLTLTKCS